MDSIIDLQTIKAKREILFENEYILDFTESSISFSENLTILTVFLVTNEYAGRPWLISKLFYFSNDYTDMLCFFNGISNPYTLEEGYKLIIPTLDSLRKMVKDNTKTEAQEKSKKDFSSKLTQRDKNRINQLLSQFEPNGNPDIRTPNLAPAGQPEFQVVNGKIIFGTNTSLTKCKAPLSPTQSKSEAIRQFVKNNI